MILSDNQIKKNIKLGNIKISNFNEENINPNSYDLTLNSTCKIYDVTALEASEYEILFSFHDDKYKEYHDFPSEITLDVRKENKVFEFNISDEGFILMPNHLYLFSCNEEIAIKGNLCAEVEGKSSLGRLGLDIHICACFLDSGFEGSLVLELRTIYPLKIYPNMKICQIKYNEVCGVIEQDYSQKKGSKYMNQSGVQESLMYKNFDYAEKK